MSLAPFVAELSTEDQQLLAFVAMGLAVPRLAELLDVEPGEVLKRRAALRRRVARLAGDIGLAARSNVGPQRLLDLVDSEAAIDDDLAARMAKLRPRERQVFELTVRGMSMAETAALLELTANTINDHRRSMYRKLGVSTAVETAVLAARAGLA